MQDKQDCLFHLDALETAGVPRVNKKTLILSSEPTKFPTRNIGVWGTQLRFGKISTGGEGKSYFWLAICLSGT
jgi:hypothetical protein